MYVIIIVLELVMFAGVMVTITWDSNIKMMFARLGMVGSLFIIPMTIDVYSRVVEYNHSIETVTVTEEENDELMNSINDLVKDYYDLDTDVYNQIESGTLFTMYPEVKNDVTKMQMETITDNQNKIEDAKSSAVESKTRLDTYGVGFLIDEA